jgi:hypothetical protein
MKLLNAADEIENPAVDRVILIGKDRNHLCRLIGQYRNKIKEIHFHGPLEDSFALMKEKNPDTVIKLFTSSKEEIIKNTEALREKSFFICPEYLVNTLEDISFITSMGISVDLMYRIESVRKGIILEILHYLLHHSTRNIPINPFHDILKAKIKDDKLNLWGLYSMPQDTYFFLDEPGLIEGIEKLDNRFYLTLVDWKSRQAKNGFRPNGLQKYFESIPREHPACMACEQFHSCFAWGKYKSDICDLWKTILDRIQTHAGRIKKVLNAQSA